MDIFMDYNEIQMASKDEEHATFITNKGIYRYKVILFGLKNAGATYQRLVNKLFKIQIGRNMEVYVDDILIKNFKTSNHVRNLKKAFDTLRQYQIKLNPIKYAFGVTVEIFFGFIVSQ